MSCASQAQAAEFRFDIPSQPVSSALQAFSRQSGYRILFPARSVDAYRSQGVQGYLPADRVLSKLIEGTPLRIASMSNGIVALKLKDGQSGHLTPVTASAFAGVQAGGGTSAPAERTQAPAAAPEDGAGGTIIVTGTRASSRTVAGSLAPIDVLTAKDLESSGKQSVRDLLGTLMPSISVSNAGSGANFAVKALTLRGLGSDELLVLVNGKRRHDSAILFTSGTVVGQSPPDLDLIPGNAIQHIEVLRDGAAAQYGSDAIAGVINILLKKDTGGSASLTMGGTADNGGMQSRMQVDKGFALGSNGGYLHLSADGVIQDATVVQSTLISGYANRGKYGQPKVTGGNASYDAMVPIGDNAELYSFGTVSKRDATGWLTWRTPTASNSNITLYPDGYTPRIRIMDTDFQFAAGVRGDLGSLLHYDLSSSYAQDKADYNETTTYNTSLGNASPTRFYLGSLRFDEWVTNLDLSKSLDLGLAAPLTMALGAEYKWNQFQLSSGEYGAYYGLGAQGTSGFSPSQAGIWSRNNWSIYASLEQRIVKGVEVALAGRHEDYSDFGATNTGKASVRIEPLRGFALRGTASTGFRAPSLQQQHYGGSGTNSVTINGVNQLAPVLTLPVDNPAARALGASSLKPEESTSYSAGIVLTPLNRLNITVDAYQIKVRNRILLSDTLQGDSVVSVLRASGNTAAYGVAFFSNAADTRTRGLDVVSTYKADLGHMGSATFSLSANLNKTIFTRVAASTIGTTLVGRARQGDVSEGTPRNKFIANVLWDWGNFSTNLRATRYGNVVYRATSQVYYNQSYATCAAGSAGCSYGYVDDTVKPKVIVDLEVGYKVAKGIKVSVGANNLLNTYPTRLSPVNQTSGALYNSYSPYGFSGGFYYGKINMNF